MMIVKSFLMTCLLTTFTLNSAVAEQMVGVNIAGAEFKNQTIPGRHGFDYIWPNSLDIARFANAGFKVVRVPFLWERMQPELNQPFSVSELKNLDTAIEAANNNNIKLIIDLHNYGRYRGNLIGSAEVPIASFQDFWKRIAERYKDYPNVIFGVMNEPNKQTSEEWAMQAQAAVDAIRSAGANQLILVPGTRWTGAHSWISSGNAEALKSINDPQNNYAFDMHQYFDSDSSGTHASCVAEDVGVKRLEKATQWLNQTGNKAFLGEFGASKDPVCLKALENTLAYLKQNQNVWVGWGYWAAGKWWGNYMFSIHDLDINNTPQYRILNSYM